MTIASIDTLITEKCAGYSKLENYYTQFQAAKTATLFTGNLLQRCLMDARIGTLPTLPGGKTYYMPTYIDLTGSVNNATYTLARLTSFGSLNIATPTFTDGSAAPTITEGGVSRQIPSAILAVCTTGLNATPGSITVTYRDQDNNTAETTASIALTASVVAGTAGFLNLNGTDWGAVDITAATRTGGTSPTGVIEFFHVWPICQLTTPGTTSMIAVKNFLTDDSLLFKFAAGEKIAIIGTGTGARGLQGKIEWLAM
jgi:hypothetical protein